LPQVQQLHVECPLCPHEEVSVYLMSTNKIPRYLITLINAKIAGAVPDDDLRLARKSMR
jgi:hypothetical protein